MNPESIIHVIDIVGWLLILTIAFVGFLAYFHFIDPFTIKASIAHLFV